MMMAGTILPHAFIPRYCVYFELLKYETIYFSVTANMRGCDHNVSMIFIETIDVSSLVIKRRNIDPARPDPGRQDQSKCYMPRLAWFKVGSSRPPSAFREWTASLTSTAPVTPFDDKLNRSILHFPANVF